MQRSDKQLRRRLVAVALVGVVALGACGSDSDDDAEDGAAADSPAALDDGVVAIVNFKFVPTPASVPVGTTVTWRNDDSAPHTATSDSGSAIEFDSGNLAEGDTYEHTFDEAGTFTYRCDIHQYMTAQITVTE